MTSASSSHGASTRQPVVHGGRRIPSLWQRALKDGATAYEASLRIDGKKKRVVLTARTVTEAIRELEALRVDRDRGVAQENPLINPTVAELFEEFLAHMQSRVAIRDEKHRYAQSTVDMYRDVARQYLVPFMGHKRVASLTAPDLRRLIAHLQSDQPTHGALAPSTTSRMMQTLSVALTFATKSGYIERNIYHDLPREDRPGGKRLTEPRYLTAEEVALLLDTVERGHPRTTRLGKRHRAVFACMAYAALRCSETLGLTWKSLDFKADEISVTAQLSRDARELVPTKTTGSATTVVMAPALKRDLLAWRSYQAGLNIALIRPDAFVFVGERGGGPCHRPVSAWLCASPATTRDSTGRALPRVSPHDLRHTAIALAIQSGAPITEVCEFARHVSPDVSLRAYAGLANDARGGAMRRMLDAGYGV